MTSDDMVLDALSALRDAGLVTDRVQLNRAWAELTGRTPPTSGARCQNRGCHAVGFAFTEPVGAFCVRHIPRLWRDVPENGWATPRCRTCGAPARRPNSRFGSHPTCRAHANARLRKYLHTPTVEEEIA